MNARENFLNALHFKKVDRVPLIEVEAIENETIQRWYGEGLPIGMELQDYLSLDKIEYVPIDFDPIPRFVSKTLEENEKYRVVKNDIGAIVKVSKEHPTMHYYYLDYPVKSGKDWDEMKKRLNPNDPRRYPLYWGDEFIEYTKTAKHPIGIVIPWFFDRSTYYLGIKRFLTWVYQKPDLIHDMFSFYADFTKEVLKEVVEGARIDIAVFSEDLAYKNGPFISPRMYKEFWNYQKEVIGFLRRNGIEIITMWSSGNIESLIPQFMEAGFNCIWPLEVAAGMNAVELRKKYGKKLLLVGNIAKETLIKGKEAIKREVLSKVPYLMEQGGYIPAVDDRVPPQVPFQNYVYYINLLKNIF